MTTPKGLNDNAIKPLSQCHEDTIKSYILYEDNHRQPQATPNCSKQPQLSPPLSNGEGFGVGPFPSLTWRGNAVRGEWASNKPQAAPAISSPP